VAGFGGDSSLPVVSCQGEGGAVAGCCRRRGAGLACCPGELGRPVQERDGGVL
jgi:hypothetical protein